MVRPIGLDKADELDCGCEIHSFRNFGPLIFIGFGRPGDSQEGSGVSGLTFDRSEILFGQFPLAIIETRGVQEGILGLFENFFKIHARAILFPNLKNLGHLNLATIGRLLFISSSRCTAHSTDKCKTLSTAQAVDEHRAHFGKPFFAQIWEILHEIVLTGRDYYTIGRDFGYCRRLEPRDEGQVRLVCVKDLGRFDFAGGGVENDDMEPLRCEPFILPRVHFKAIYRYRCILADSATARRLNLHDEGPPRLRLLQSRRGFCSQSRSGISPIAGHLAQFIWRAQSSSSGNFRPFTS